MSNAAYIIIFFSMLILVRGFIVIFHELGHAAMGLLLYTGNLNIYIGSYGDPAKGLHFSTGRLKIHFICNPFSWDRGLCVAEQSTGSYKRRLLFLLGGPLGSLTLALLFLSLLLTGLDEILRVYAFLAFFYAFADFLNNIIPKQKVIKLFNGKLTYNDGQLLKTTLKEKDSYGFSARLAELYNKKEFKKTLEQYEAGSTVKANPLILRIAAYSYLMEKNNEACLKAFAELEKVDQFTADDHCNFALANSLLDKNAVAIEHYNKALQLAPGHYYALNNRGYSYGLIGEHQKAILDFDKTIQINPEFAYAYSNRGFSKIKSGFPEEGLMDIEKSLRLDANDAYAHRNKGIYYLEKKNYNEAYELFLKVKQLDESTHLINEYLEEAGKLKARTA